MCSFLLTQFLQSLSWGLLEHRLKATAPLEPARGLSQGDIQIVPGFLEEEFSLHGTALHPTFPVLPLFSTALPKDASLDSFLADMRHLLPYQGSSHSEKCGGTEGSK